jgi:hypothetical protein
MQFLYFIPGVNRQSLKVEYLVRLGLGDVLRDRMATIDVTGEGRLAVAGVIKGPDGHDGTIISPLPFVVLDEDAAQTQPIGYFPDNQCWTRVGSYYVGYQLDGLPGPNDLMRDDIVSGYPIMLGEEHRAEWETPVIRLKAGLTNLPDVWRFVGGKVVPQVRSDWAWAWDLSGDIWDYFDQGKDIPNELAYLWCVQLLGMNYRIGPAEASILGLLGKTVFIDILRAAINGPLVDKWRAEEKKRSEAAIADLVSSDVGCADSSPATAPPGQTSTLPPAEPEKPSPSP